METNVRHIIRNTAALCVLVFGLSACADLDVVNPNQPDRGRALSSPDDVESLIAGSYGSWWLTSMTVSGPNPILANQSFMWSAFPANFGMFFYSGFPRIAVENSPTHEFYGNMLDYTWSRAYRALSAASQGLAAIADPAVRSGFVLANGDPDEDRIRRMEAYARFVQGLALGSLAMHYNDVFYVDETVDVATLQETIGYQEAMTRALGFFDDAIQIASSGSFNANIPSEWMSVEVSRDQLIQLAHSMKARYRANVARNQDERAAVDWTAVIADVDAGITETWSMETGYFISGNWNHYMAAYMAQHPVGWQQIGYFVLGMADQSGRYQEWMALPNAEKHPNLPQGGAFLIHTPDLRFPQGADLDEQIANPGIQHIATPEGHDASYFVVGPRDWRNPERGTHRWSYYRAFHMQYHRTTPGTAPTPEVTMAEMDLLKAEGLYRAGNFPGAAALINKTRVRAGLSELAGATSGNAENTSCVPKLWDGTCGDLWEMLKWEKRIETQLWGVHSNSWFFDGRGWGDLYAGTAVTLPVPCLDRELLHQPCDTFGGQPGQPGSAPISSYAYPHEG
jgi:hypothetical protein